MRQAIREAIQELRENADHALIRNYRGDKAYEDSGPIRPRRPFTCDACEEIIHIGVDVKFCIKAYSYGSEWPTTNICGTCKIGDPKVKVAFDRIMAGEFDYD